MAWVVRLLDAFDAEFDGLPEPVQDAILDKLNLLQLVGPQLGRPHADTLNGSRYANMKELRCEASDGVWRIAYAFDPKREGIILVAGDKAGTGGKRFYKRLIATADERYAGHLDTLKRKR